MGITRIGVQPVVAATGDAPGKQFYIVSEVDGETETPSVAVGCVNDLSVDGNLNLVHWQGSGESYRVYKSQDGIFGLIGTTGDALLLDTNIAPDVAQQPPSSPPPGDAPA